MMLKKQYIKIVSLIAFVAISAFAIIAFLTNGQSTVSVDVPVLSIPAPGNDIADVSYSLELDADNAPKYANLYEFSNKKYEDADLSNVSLIFGFTEKAELTIIGDSLYLTEEITKSDLPAKVLMYETISGTWEYYNQEYDKTQKCTLPDSEKAESIANEFLVNNDLYEKRFDIIKTAIQYTGDITTDDYNPYCVSVFFYPTVEDCLALGVSRIVVDVGNNGEIISVKKLYKDINKVGSIELLAPESLYEQLLKGELSSSVDPSAQSAIIEKVILAYWEDAGDGIEQPYLQPVWVFQGTAILEDGTKSGFDVIAPAVKNSVESKEVESESDLDVYPTPEMPTS